MPVLLKSHAVREREKRVKRAAEHKGYDQTTRKLRLSLAEAKTFRSSRRWQNTRAAYLSAHPVCADPFTQHAEMIQAAGQVDHIVPLEIGGAKTDWNNLQSLCTGCHAKKSQSERRPG